MAIAYPSPEDHPYARLDSAVARQSQDVRAADELRRTTIPRLLSRFHEVNEATFAGRLPEPTIRIEEGMKSTVRGYCKWQRWSWVEPHAIRLSTSIQDDPARLVEVFEHEVAHLATFAVDAWYEKDHHGPRFRSILEHIKDGEPYTGSEPEPEPSKGPAARTVSRTTAPVPAVRSRNSGTVRATMAGQFGRSPGELVRVASGQLMPADHWAVRRNPDMFGAA